MPSWSDPAWLADAHTWIRASVERAGDRVTGTIEQAHIRPWSTVLRAPTTAGDVWFKANGEPHAYEAGLVELLARRRPDCVPELLAVDRDRGWLLMADGGERLREAVGRERDLDRWLDVLPRYGGLQLDAAADVDAFLALGLPDRRLASLPEQYAALVPDAPELTRRRRCGWGGSAARSTSTAGRPPSTRRTARRSSQASRSG